MTESGPIRVSLCTQAVAQIAFPDVPPGPLQAQNEDKDYQEDWIADYKHEAGTGDQDEQVLVLNSTHALG